LRRERTSWVRLVVIAIFITFEVYSIYILHRETDGQARILVYLHIALALMVFAGGTADAINTAKRLLKIEEADKQITDISSKYVSTRELLFRIDNETREEVGAWLHGTLQPQLVRLAKDIRTNKLNDCELVAQRVDEIAEKYVRDYSHSLYPPALAISIEVALETMLEGRAELVLDERLTNAADLGYAIWSSESETSSNKRVQRLHLAAEISYATYRIIEEAVANAEKKSSTTRIVVDVRIESGQVRISVRDNGDPISDNAKAGLGHSVINAFIQKFHGTMTMNNVANGVEVLVFLPYKAPALADMLHKRFQGGSDE
jgi:signal transduction histidine kinase